MWVVNYRIETYTTMRSQMNYCDHPFYNSTYGYSTSEETLNGKIIEEIQLSTVFIYETTTINAMLYTYVYIDFE